MQHGGGFRKRQKVAPINNDTARRDAPWLRTQTHDRNREYGFAATALPNNTKGSALQYFNLHAIHCRNITHPPPEHGAQAFNT